MVVVVMTDTMVMVRLIGWDRKENNSHNDGNSVSFLFFKNSLVIKLFKGLNPPLQMTVSNCVGAV